MGRPRKTIRSIEKNISIPENLVIQVDLRLFSDLEGKVPHGGWSRYIQKLIRKDLEGRKIEGGRNA